MNTGCRLAILSGLLVMGIEAGTAGAQVPSTAAREQALPLDAPATQLDPVPPDAAPLTDSDVAAPETSAAGS